MVVKVPIDIIESNILWRLPVKTLVRFRSVEKLWYSLISTPYFINLHRNRNLQNKDNNENLFVMCYFPQRGIQVMNSSSNVLYAFNINNTHLSQVVGSCNGIICIYGTRYHTLLANTYPTEKSISLWNPALRINKILCYETYSSGIPDEFDMAGVGFGFHKQTNDYKVISFTSKISAHGLTTVRIYSLSSDSWRDIEVSYSWSLRYKTFLKFGVYVSDAYCWFGYVSKHNESPEGRIISFDMRDEVFKEMMLPPVNSPTPDILTLFSYKDLLAVLDRCEIADLTASQSCDVWVMKEYNDANSWTKVCKFDVQNNDPYSYVEFMGIILETELVLKLGYWEVKVVDIDDPQKNTSSIKASSMTQGAFYISSFAESLVLLDADSHFNLIMR